MFKKLFFCFLLKTFSAAAMIVLPKDLDKAMQTMQGDPSHLIIATMKVHTETKYQNSDALLDLLRNRTEKGLPSTVVAETRLSHEETRPANAEASSPLQVLRTTGATVVTDYPHFTSIQTKLAVSQNCLWLATGQDSPIALKEKDRIRERDFVIVLEKNKHPGLVKQAYTVFQNIAAGKQVEASALKSDLTQLQKGGAILAWGPWYHKEHLLNLIQSAKKTIDIAQQDLQDPEITAALVAQAQHGVTIRILMSKVPFRTPMHLTQQINKSSQNLHQLRKAGATIRLVGHQPSQSPEHYPLHIHARILVIDGQAEDCRMYLGSAPFFHEVLNSNSNKLHLGVIMRETPEIQQVLAQFEKDWQEGEDF